jgi:hypothetical protein
LIHLRARQAHNTSSERLEKAARSTFALVFWLLALSERSFEGAEIRLTKNDSISTAYEFRTKSAQSGGLEKNGWREGIAGTSRSVAVWRFAREDPYLLGDFCGLASEMRMLAADGLAEGVGFELAVRIPLGSKLMSRGSVSKVELSSF